MTAPRRNVMLGTAGHVDHGKTALVKLLTGCETDTMAEEQQRGLTIDLGFAPCRLADQRVVGVVDVPGHVDFIRNMVAGAHGIDVVILVVAADDGIMPQTREHLDILTLMGLRYGLVALTKIDLVPAERRETVAAELRTLLAGTCLADAPIAPLSNLTGEGFASFFDALNAVVGTCEDRPVSGDFRLWIEDAFSIRGAGTVVTGIPTNGVVRPGERLFWLPGGLPGHVRRLQVYGADSNEGRAGECVALNIPELDAASARRGMQLTARDNAALVSMAEAEVCLLRSVSTAIADYTEVQVHVGTASVAANLALLESGRIHAGERQCVQLRLLQALPLLPGDRFVIRGNVSTPTRTGLTTLGGGRLLGLSNTRLRRKKPWTLAALRARQEALEDPARWLEQAVKAADQPTTVQELQRETPLRLEEIASHLAHLHRQGRLLPTSSSRWVHREAAADAATAVLAALGAAHAAQPERLGFSRPEFLASLPLNPETAELGITTLLAEGRVQASGALLALPDWTPKVPAGDRTLSAAVEMRLRESGWTPPSLRELATALGQPPDRITAALRVLADHGAVTRLAEDLWMHRNAVEAGRQVALRLFRAQGSFSTMAFRDALGVSRKFAVPLLDHLDTLRFTTRSGHQRTPGAEARKLLAPPASPV